MTDALVTNKRRVSSPLGWFGRALLFGTPVAFFLLLVLLANRRGGFRKHNSTRGHAQYGSGHRFLFVAQLHTPSPLIYHYLCRASCATLTQDQSLFSARTNDCYVAPPLFTNFPFCFCMYFCAPLSVTACLCVSSSVRAHALTSTARRCGVSGRSGSRSAASVDLRTRR